MVDLCEKINLKNTSEKENEMMRKSVSKLQLKNERLAKIQDTKNDIETSSGLLKSNFDIEQCKVSSIKSNTHLSMSNKKHTELGYETNNLKEPKDTSKSTNSFDEVSNGDFLNKCINFIDIRENIFRFEKLLNELKSALAEARGKVKPLLQRIRSHELISREGITYLEVKLLLLLSYCAQIVFLLLLKMNSQSTSNHPIISRLAQTRTFLEMLRPIDQSLGRHLNCLAYIADRDFNKNVSIDTSEPRGSITKSFGKNLDHILYQKNNSMENNVRSPPKEIEKKYKNHKKRETESKDDRLHIKKISDDKTILKHQFDNSIHIKNNLKRQESKSNQFNKIPETCVDSQNIRFIGSEIFNNKGILPYRNKKFKNSRKKHRIEFEYTIKQTKLYIIIRT
eukprot:gnl/TRDRNA2_/TRDRNA2_177657_c0_seq2.p1 gnl/TRDRNA2_/TRDRNA2_177657_c0~~gnl/TRDRNA2_/TRDRNA2_177657_c0_seq2.p1  ORF type:complete len:395 (+),score=-19.49 gnl/TRDRNA2_/TRDRNA2_177657_c0_seq2:64-1248(+)